MRGIDSQAVGKIAYGIEPNTLALRIIDFVYRQLPAWRDHRELPEEQSEDT